jgi:hypothetical protein
MITTLLAGAHAAYRRLVAEPVGRARRWLIAKLRPIPSGIALSYVEGDGIPAVIPAGTLVVAREDGELWSAGMLCPCGCGRVIELMLLPDVKPRWDLAVDRRSRPSLSPSVWAIGGCRSHFWLRSGQVHWCCD